MKSFKLILTAIIGLFLLVAITSCNEKNKESEKSKTISPTISKEELENEVWQMEERYWDYVMKNDTIAYKKLWHNDFIGYPSFGEGVSNKSKIASWIPGLHEDKNRIFSYKLYKKAVNSIADVVVVFYDFDEIWTEEQIILLRKKHLRLPTPGNNWVILG